MEGKAGPHIPHSSSGLVQKRPTWWFKAEGWALTSTGDLNELPSCPKPQFSPPHPDVAESGLAQASWCRACVCQPCFLFSAQQYRNLSCSTPIETCTENWNVRGKASPAGRQPMGWVNLYKWLFWTRVFPEIRGDLGIKDQQGELPGA